VISIGEVADYFEEVDSGRWKCKQTGFDIALGILEFYQSAPAAGDLAGFTAYGLPLGNEEYPKHGVSVQRFERGTLVYDPGRTYDSPPGAVGPVYAGRVDTDVTGSTVTKTATVHPQARRLGIFRRRP
jgi:hypothetical protein